MSEGGEIRYCQRCDKSFAAPDRPSKSGQRRCPFCHHTVPTIWKEPVWKLAADANRIAPRDCIAAARGDLNQAYGSTDPRAIPIFLLSALDWMRRALEQMADTGERE